VLHGTLPAPGVWSMEGFGQRHAKNVSLNSAFVPTAEAMMAHGADMLTTNSFYSNGGHEQAYSSARALHLDSNLVPFAPAPSAASPSRQPASPSKSPAAHRISAVDWTRFGFEEGAAGGVGASPSRTPQRMCVDGAWRLNSSLSSPSLPVTYSPCPGASKHVVRQPERAVQLDNYALAEARSTRQRADRREVIAEEQRALAAWDTRWGFLQARNTLDAPSRRKHVEVPHMPSLTSLGS